MFLDDSLQYFDAQANVYCDEKSNSFKSNSMLFVSNFIRFNLILPEKSSPQTKLTKNLVQYKWLNILSPLQLFLHFQKSLLLNILQSNCQIMPLLAYDDRLNCLNQCVPAFADVCNYGNYGLLLKNNRLLNIIIKIKTQ